MQAEAAQGGQTQGEEDAELRGCAENEQLRVFQQGAKVDHGADAHKQQQGEQLVGDAGVVQHIQHAFLSPLGDSTRVGQVDQNGAEAHGQQQAGLHVFFNGKVDQQAAYGPHNDHAHIQLQ